VRVDIPDATFSDFQNFDDLDETEINDIRIKAQATMCMRICGLATVTQNSNKKEQKQQQRESVIALYFNTINGRAFASTPSPQFEVLAPLVPCVRQIIGAVDDAVRLGVFQSF
jgi:hypothetical protein